MEDSRPAKTDTKVVFPAPFCPSNAHTLDFFARKLTFCRMRLVTFIARMASSSFSSLLVALFVIGTYFDLTFLLPPRMKNMSKSIVNTVQFANATKYTPLTVTPWYISSSANVFHDNELPCLSQALIISPNTCNTLAGEKKQA